MVPLTKTKPQSSADAVRKETNKGAKNNAAKKWLVMF
jgi:hypothetical protein